MGAGLVAYNLAYFSQLVLDGNLLELYRRRRLRKQLEHMSDHFIICGYGQMGKIIAQELSKNHVPVVVVENDPSVLVSIRERKSTILREMPPRKTPFSPQGSSVPEGWFPW